MVHSDTLRFLKEFILAPTTVGAIAASSKGLADAVVEAAGVARSSVVVEFGPGTGAITGSIVDHLPRDAAFFGMEISEVFVQSLQKKFPGVMVFHDSAVDTRKYLNQLSLPYTDCIVSGLPWSAFKDDLQYALLDTIYDVLRPGGGKFVTFMYVMSPILPAGRKFIRRLRKRFEGNVHISKPVWLNLPPALVITAEKK